MNQYRIGSSPAVAKALQFTGGAENAAAVTEWLKPYGYRVRHHEARTEALKNALGHSGHPYPEYISASESTRGYLNVAVGDFIVVTPQGHIYTATEESFWAMGHVLMTEDDVIPPHHSGDLKLRDWVRFTGTVAKVKEPSWDSIRYVDRPLPGFIGYGWTPPIKTTQNYINEGVVMGKRRYTSMVNEEGCWVPDGVQVFTGYLIAYHLSRKPVIVRLDQIMAEAVGL